MPHRAIELLKDKLPSQPRIIIEQSLKHDMDELVAGLLPRLSIAVVDDPRTAQAAGDRVVKALASKFRCTRITFEAAPAADEDAAEFLRVRSSKCDALVAVGSGAINDICKYVSHADGKPYIAIPTAASMNGYLSANASITIGGYKQTMPAHMPSAVLCDMSIIAAAPARLNKSGMGDSLARSTAQADWLLSHLILHTPYDESVFKALTPLEEELYASARGVAQADMQSLTVLMRTLLISGLGMTAAGGSYPASQGEHMIAHTYEMMTGEKNALHGEAIGVTTLTMARMQEKLLHKIPKFRRDTFDDRKLETLFGKKVMQEAKKAFAKKEVLLDGREINNWEQIAARISGVTLPVDRLHRVLEELEAPATPAQLDWQDAHYDMALYAAHFLRDRFTFLDLM